MSDRWQEYLLPGERLLWSGQPDHGRSARSHLYIWVFVVPAYAFAFHIIGELAEAPAHIRYVFGPAGIAGLLTTPLLPWIAAYRINHSFYALTDRRVIVDERYVTGQRYVMSLPLAQTDARIIDRVIFRNVDLGPWRGMDGHGGYKALNGFIASAGPRPFRLKLRGMADPYRLWALINEAKTQSAQPPAEEGA